MGFHTTKVLTLAVERYTDLQTILNNTYNAAKQHITASYEGGWGNRGGAEWQNATTKFQNFKLIPTFKSKLANI